METKVCRVCGVEKPLDAYYRARESRDGHRHTCKDCQCASARQWSRNNRKRSNRTAKERRDRLRGAPPRPMKNVIVRDGVTYKRCSQCGQEKLPDEFHKQATGSLGRQNRCKPCGVRLAYEWSRANPERFRRNQFKSRLKRKYGLTPEMVDELLNAQGGRCAICRDELEPGGTAIDHCHTEGNVRGLLCRHCNTGLGLFKDDEKRLLAAVKYLRAARRQPVA